MSDPYRKLGSQLQAAARRQERGRWSWWSWAGRYRGPLLGIVAVLVSASAAAAVVSTLRSTSPPLSGDLPAHAGQPLTRYRFAVYAPELTVGSIGWCVSDRFERAGKGALSGGCGPAAPAETSLIGGAVAYIGRGQGLLDDIVDRRVVAVRLPGGRLVTPRASPTLPNGWRAVIAVVAWRPTMQHLVAPMTQLLDAQGRVLSTAFGRYADTRRTGTERLPAAVVSAVHPPEVPCALRAAPTPGLRPISEQIVLARPQKAPDVNGRAYLVCSAATFTLHGTRLRVSELVDAQRPARVAMILPNTRPVSGRPGERAASAYPSIVNVAPRRLLVAITALRDGPAWLIATGGTTATRQTLLNALLARGR